MGRSRLLIALVLGLAAFLVAGLAVASADESIEQAEPVDPSLVVLVPGENLVGWVGASRSAAWLRRLAPNIESIQAWDAQSQQLVDAASMNPGKAYVITLGGEESASFRRPMTPVLGKMGLKRGRNLVTWLGPDDWSIDRVVLGVGRALVRIDWDGRTYRASQGTNTRSLPLVQRGDALWVEVSRTVNWLQPAGVMPTIKFAGDASPGLKSVVRSDSIDVMSHFAEEFGVQPDGSILTVYVAAGPESLTEAFEQDGRESSGIYKLWYTAGGWASPTGYVVLKLEQWEPDYGSNEQGIYGDYTYGRGVLAHEYYHAIQQQTSSTNAAQWLVEGGADWAQAGIRRRDAESSFEDELAGNRRFISSGDAPPLDHTERDVGTWHYTLGALASHQLALRSGKQALVEFWRALLPEPLGPLGRWKSNPPWQNAFQDVFGFSVEEFYAEFASWRGNLAPVAVRGRVLGPGGQGLPYVRVVGRSPRLQDDGYDYFNTNTDQDGHFVLSVSELGFAEVGVDLGGCTVYYTSSGVVSGWSQAEQLSTTEEGSQNLRLRLSNDVCVWQISGRMLDADGNPMGNTQVSAVPENGVWSSTRTESDGSFAITVPRGGCFESTRGSTAVTSTTNAANVQELTDRPQY